MYHLLESTSAPSPLHSDNNAFSEMLSLVFILFIFVGIISNSATIKNAAEVQAMNSEV